MTRFRIRLLITLALLAAMTTVAVSVASAVERLPDGTTTQLVTGSLKGPGIGQTSGEPDLGGNNSPTKVSSHSVTPSGPDAPGWPFPWTSWGRWIWAAWFPILLRF